MNEAKRIRKITRENAKLIPFDEIYWEIIEPEKEAQLYKKIFSEEIEPAARQGEVWTEVIVGIEGICLQSLLHIFWTQGFGVTRVWEGNMLAKIRVCWVFEKWELK